MGFSLLAKMAPIARAIQFARQKQLDDEKKAFEKEKRDRERKQWAIQDELNLLNIANAKTNAERRKIENERSDEKYKRENFLTGNDVIAQAGGPPALPATMAGVTAAAGSPFAPGMATPAMSQAAKDNLFRGPWAESTDRPRLVPLSVERKTQADELKARQKMAMDNLNFLQGMEKAKYIEDRRDERAAKFPRGRGGGSGGKARTPKEPKGTEFIGTGQQKFSIPQMSTFFGSLPGGVPIPASGNMQTSTVNRLNGNVLSIPGFGNVTLGQYSKLSDQDVLPFQQAAGQGGIPQAWEVTRKIVSSKTGKTPENTDEARFIESLKRRIASKEINRAKAEEYLRRYREAKSIGLGMEANPSPAGVEYMNKLMPKLDAFFSQGMGAR